MNFNGIDSLSLSGHKFNGLKGQGLLLIKNIQNIEPVIHGGGQVWFKKWYGQFTDGDFYG